jgi:hypothetical protein
MLLLCSLCSSAMYATPPLPRPSSEQRLLELFMISFPNHGRVLIIDKQSNSKYLLDFINYLENKKSGIPLVNDKA